MGWFGAGFRRDRPLLVSAAEEGNVAAVEFLLQHGSAIDEVDYRRQTACHAAARKGRADALRALLAHRQRPNLELTDASGDTPLGVSLWNDDVQIVVMLLKAGASLATVSRRRLYTMVGWSADIIQALLDRGVVIGDLRDDDGQTPLHTAVSAPLPLLNWLVSLGIDINMTDRWGRTMVHALAVSGNLSIQLGADLECVAIDGRTPLHGACASISGYRCVLELLAAGASANGIGTDSCTPLHAVARGKFRGNTAPCACDAVRWCRHGRCRSTWNHCSSSIGQRWCAGRCGSNRCRAPADRQAASRLCARACVAGVHWSTIVENRRSVHVRDSNARLRPARALGRVSSLVADCNHCEAFLQSQSGQIIRIM
jgi:ankyrin repeat protein